MSIKSQIDNYIFIDYIGSEKLELIRPIWEKWQNHPNVEYNFFSAVADNRPSVIDPLAIAIYNNETPLALAACRLENAELPIKVGYVNLTVFSIRQLTIVYSGLMGAWDDSITKAFICHIRELMRKIHIDVVYFSAMPNESPVYKMINHQIPFPLRCNAHKNNLHWTTKLSVPYEEFLQRISKKHQKQLRKQEDKLASKEGPLQIKIFQTPADVEEYCVIAEMITKATYLRGIGAGFQYNIEAVKRLSVMAEKGLMQGYVLYANNRPCSFWLATLYNRVLHLDYTGFDPELKDFNPGQILLNKMIETFCTNGLADSIDFGFGDAFYKMQYGDHNFLESDIFMFNNTPLMILANVVQNTSALVNRGIEKTLKRSNLYDRIKKLSRQSAAKAINKTIHPQPDKYQQIQKRKSMRICMISYSFYESDNRVRRYAEALVKRGDSVDIIALGQPDHPRKTTLSGVSVFRIQTRKFDEKKNIDYLFKIMLFFLRSFLTLTWRHIFHPYQLVHVHSVPDFEIFAAVATKLTGAKLVLDIHDIVPEFYTAKFGSGKSPVISKILVLVEKASCAFSDHVIISNHLWWEKLVSRSVNHKKCSTILNYPDPSIFKGDFPRASEETFSLIYPGTHSYHQGIDIAIRALALVKESNIPFHFDIYGKGPDEDSLKNLVFSLGLKDFISFHGFIELSQIAAIMARAHLGIIPKRADGFGNEAFSTKIFEFMALRVPVLISNTKIDQYYFNDSVVMFFESGNVRQLADKISFLAKNKQVRETLVANSSAFIKQYNWELKKNEYFHIVDSLTNKSRQQHEQI